MAGSPKSINFIRAGTSILLIVMLLLPISGCSVNDITNGVTGVSRNLVENSTSTVQSYLDGEEAPDVKFDTFSAGDAINGSNASGENYMFDEKSGMYVTPAQYRANHFADSLKLFWIPSCVIMFFFGFLIRRLNHSSAAIRRFGFFLEIILPIVLTTFVYIFCALADSSMMSIFDGIF